MANTICEPETGYRNIDYDPPGGGGHFDTLSVVHKDSADNPVTWTQVGTDSTYTRYVRTSDTWFWLRAAVWDSAGDSIVNRRMAVETWDGGGKAALALLATHVGVRLRDGTCSPRLPVGDPGRQAWLQMIMETVERIEYCRVEARTP